MPGTQSPTKPKALAQGGRRRRPCHTAHAGIALIAASMIMLITSFGSGNADELVPALYLGYGAPTSVTWQNLTSNPSPPTMPGGSTLVYDPSGHEIITVVWPPRGGCGAPGETWALANGHWADLNLTTEPPVVVPLLTYDPVSAFIVLYNSEFCTANGTSSTWTFHAGVWTNITATSGTQPPPVSRHR